MKKIVFTILTVISIAISVPAYADQEAKEILKAVVKIRSIIPKESHSAGTLGTEREGNGVVIDSKGHILTIGYLIIEAESIEVTPPEGKPVSAKFEGYGEDFLEEALYTAPAFVNYGGAALIDRNGQLVGIGSLLSQVVIPGFGTIPCNISVPIDLLPPILDDLITKGRPQKAPKPWLGINAEEAQGRVFITRGPPGGPGEKGGLKPGDLVLAVKGREVNGLTDFYRKVWALGNAGGEIPLAILQGIQIREITIRSSDRYQFLMLKPQKIL